MSFENHPTVAAYLEAHKRGLSGFESLTSVYRNLAKTFYNELNALEEEFAELQEIQNLYAE